MNAICITCGTQFAESSRSPDRCPICDEERQYVGLHGQQWTTLDDLRRDRKTQIEDEEPGLTSFSIDPKFGIGQRAFVIQTPSGNMLWDCISLLDDVALAQIKSLGGVSAIAISHPHYYTCMVEWSRAFGDVDIYLHRDDAQWVMRPDKRIHYWDGERYALPGNLRLIRCGGHFKGASVLHWPEGAGGNGALLAGDTIQVVLDRRWVSFMYSYPNYIPLNAAEVQRIVASVEMLDFERIYGAFPAMTVQSDGKGTLRRSADRYLKAVQPV
ncbi:MAG: MBL fold metallo-hydrolase [Acidobacteriota bacterium]|nr:MBL fold metallo-hydrolase [Acidobacteriota bacterium]